MANSPTCHWSEVKAHAKTGDLLLFCGEHWISQLITMLERRDFSHCAIFFVIDNEQEAQLCALPRGVYMAESDLAAHGEWSTDNADFSGVQLIRNSEARLRAYDGQVFWVPLKQVSESNLVRNQLLKPYLAQLCGYCPYNESLQTWVISGLRDHTTPTCNTRAEHGHYCISFACEALQTMGVMTQRFNPFNVHFNTLTEPWRRTQLMMPNNVYSDTIIEIKDL